MLQGIRLLAVDDDEMSLEMLATILGSQGVQCTAVTNGRLAMDALESNPDMDIVLLDIQMPIMDGFEVLRQCKGNPYLCDIPVIVLASNHEERLKSLQLGADDFLAKPYDLEELELRITRLVQSHTLAQRAERAKREFLTIASHELRTPMHHIIGLAEIMNGENLSITQQGHIDQLKNATADLTDLIGDILSYVQLDAGAVKASMEPFSLRAAVQGAIDACREDSGKKGITCELELADTVPDALDGPSLYVSKIFSILIGNALKFSSDGPIKIAVHEESFGKFGSLFCCSVSDRGIGILAEHQDRIFEPFVQADSSGTRNFEGIGLGLAIARRMVELMGGTISVQSDDGTGSSFKFSFYCHLQDVMVEVK